MSHNPGSITTSIILTCALLISGCVEVEVNTTKGALIGYEEDGVQRFLGIPYAKNPVGELRWQAPQPHDGWSGKRRVMSQPKACVQGGSPTGAIGSRENCLYLNVWAPASPGPHPVMVWVHGGGFLIGSANELQYDGSELAKSQDVIVVSMNYRLSYLGFLTLPQFDGLAPHTVNGNQGLLDQVAALQWVKDNIEQFGGNADNITVFGESAGSISACLLLASPLTDNLINKVIMQSGGCNTFYTRSRAEAEAQGLAFLEKVGCKDSANPLSCARALSPQQIQLALGIKPNELFRVDPQKWGFSPGASIDGYLLTDQPHTLLANSSKADSVAMLIGTNADEGSLFVGARAHPASEEDYIPIIEQTFPGLGAELAQLYPFSDFSPSGEASSQIVTDSAMTCPSREAADIWSQTRNVYFYHFTQQVSAPLMGFLGLMFTDNAPDLGTFHAAELPYVFGIDGVLGQANTAEQKATRAGIMQYWGNFARNGDPNGLNLNHWPSYTADNASYLVLNQDFQSDINHRQAYCDFWKLNPVSF
jgi:para-nitrobenzyl esterase